MARVQKVHEFIWAWGSYWTEVTLAKSGQKAADRMDSLKPEDEVARGRFGQISIVLASGRSGQKSKRPEAEVARGMM